MMKRLFLLLALLSVVATVSAQTMREEIDADPDRAGGIYCYYRPLQAAPTPAPRGYKPFYISHYGRHGCRFQASSTTYTMPLSVFEAAAKDAHLTPLGEDALRRLRIVVEDANLRYADLAPRGEREHRGIANRMMDNYPEVFRGARHVSCFSTQAPRCMMSMAAFTDVLKERNSRLDISRRASLREMQVLACAKGMDSIRKPARKLALKYQLAKCNDRAFLERLFGDYDYAMELLRRIYGEKKTYVFIDNMHALAVTMQDCDYLGISFHDLFTADERYMMWDIMNVRRYLTYGPSAEFGDVRNADGKPLLRDIIERADKVVSGEMADEAAALRFGHDSYIIPLLSLMRVEGCHGCVDASQFDRLSEVWCDSRITSMAVNVQFVFFRNKRGDVLVKMMHSEREVRIPVSTDSFPFYKWEDFRAYCVSLLD